MIHPPLDTDSLEQLFYEDDFDRFLGPVQADETTLLVQYTHRGPDLLTLDLSELRIVD